MPSGRGQKEKRRTTRRNSSSSRTRLFSCLDCCFEDVDSEPRGGDGNGFDVITPQPDAKPKPSPLEPTPSPEPIPQPRPPAPQPPHPTIPAEPSPPIYDISQMSGKYESIREQCLKSRTLYEDNEFFPHRGVLFQNGPRFGVRWLRPPEISKNPVYRHEGIVYYDINQGELGNCWFIASVASLAASPQRKLLERVVPRDQGFGSNYCGAFRFFFWRFGKWEEVIIDDKLPTMNGRLIYGNNVEHPDEFWAPLLEKAYAKLNGSYDALDGGVMHSALVDLTGGLGEMVDLREEITDKKLKEILLNCQGMNSFMGGLIFNELVGTREIKQDTGLYAGHAYSVVQIKEIRKGNTSTVLIHLRNPWGRGEWNGAWSDGSREWQTMSKEDRDSTFKTSDDGEFWMSLSDFRIHFEQLDLCHLTPDALTDEIADNLARSKWKCTEHYGNWVPGISAGGSPVRFSSRKFWTNPQFRFNLMQSTRPTTVVISLFEVPGENFISSSYISIGFVIFKLQRGRKPKRINAENFYDFRPELMATSGAYWPYRERTLRFVMDPEEYVIVPCTYDQDKESEFYLRIFAEDGELSSNELENIEGGGDGGGDTDKPVTPPEPVTPTPEPVTPTPKPPTPGDPEEDAGINAVLTAFSKVAGGKDSIDAEEMVPVLKAGIHADGETDHQGFNIETCRCLLGLSNTTIKKDGLVTREGIRKVWSDFNLWRKAFRLVDMNKNKSVNSTELKQLFEAIDITISDDAISTLMSRYGGRARRMTEEDFLQAFCKTMLSYRIYQDLDEKKKLRMTMQEFMAAVLTM